VAEFKQGLFALFLFRVWKKIHTLIIIGNLHGYVFTSTQKLLQESVIRLFHTSKIAQNNAKCAVFNQKLIVLRNV